MVENMQLDTILPGSFNPWSPSKQGYGEDEEQDIILTQIKMKKALSLNILQENAEACLFYLFIHLAYCSLQGRQSQDCDDTEEVSGSGDQR